MTTEDTTQTSAEPSDGTPAADNPADPGDALGDAGKRALAALRSENKELKARLKALEDTSAAERDASEETASTSGSTRDAAPTSDEGTAATADDVKPTPPRFQGTADGGARMGTAPARQLTADDLRSMSPRAIDQARREGRLRDILRGNGR
ncbi:hypothetical protein [Streptomyces chiangmaiensis]|uniref:Uncharacterized protein n=1 Tax=Streptomyces chiangmaiensis TaxID=766497 RepID=A0ABU7FF31_9ACTN|nr:hypothetical protein [Streptomyces chiangmaiensis]MED7822586.1 hypothetical protein [Streptomyces chiangmaiensis]